MAKSATVRARVAPQLKARAERVLEKLGLSATTAITLYYEQIVLRCGIPFDVVLPNATTRRAMRDAESGRGLTRLSGAAALRAHLEQDD
ncbi:MAG: type II toxin-antitoxin system RelB/DinJ family antitoxin [Gemmatimonadaceae bacterium]|nr:type II toxin-antitoxin system RelB/DinJ family antitoxin [Gemmatimonadaceae bacterium]